MDLPAFGVAMALTEFVSWFGVGLLWVSVWLVGVGILSRTDKAGMASRVILLVMTTAAATALLMLSLQVYR